MIEQNLPVIPVVLALLSAPVCMLLRKPRLVWAFALAVAAAVFTSCVALLSQVLTTGTISYAIGNWQPPYGIEYRIDTLNAFFLLIVSAIGVLVLAYAPNSLERELPKSRHALYYAVYMLCLTGLLGMTITGDAFNVFVFLEIASLSMYTLVAMGPQRRALMAAYRYLVMGTVGGTFFLIGVGLLYMKTGTLNMGDLAVRLADVGDSRAVRAGFAFLSVGLGLKIALFPLHTWLPNAYTYAPSVTTSFLAATATKVSIYVVLRFIYTIIGESHVFGDPLVQNAFIVLALAGIFVASTAAIFQDNVKRLLAYSSIAQVGYIVVGVSFASMDGLTGGLVHVFNHAIMKGGLFMAVGCVAYRTGTVDFDDLRGLGRRQPFTAAALVIGGLGMIGVPLTVGFVSKWYLVLAALDRGSPFIAILLLLSSLLALVYVWKLVEVAYFQEPPPEVEPGEAPLAMLVPTWVMIGATLFFGVNTDLTVGVARRAAALLLGGDS